MGPLHILQKINYFYYKPIQKDRFENFITHQQHHTEITHAKAPDHKQVLAIQGIQINMPRLQQDVCGTNREELPREV
jgi:hypothetical protein